MSDPFANPPQTWRCNCLVTWDPISERHVWVGIACSKHPPAGTPYDATRDEAETEPSLWTGDQA